MPSCVVPYRTRGSPPPSGRPLSTASPCIPLVQPQQNLMTMDAPAEVTVEFKAVSCWVPTSLGPPSALSAAGLKAMVGLGGKQQQAKSEMRQVRLGGAAPCVGEVPTRAAASAAAGSHLNARGRAPRVLTTSQAPAPAAGPV